jgi:hypothetical protein
MKKNGTSGRGVLASATDYLLGRNTLIGIASMMLLIISGYATWSGMHDFIIGTSSSSHETTRNVFGIAITEEFFVAVIVITLTFLMWLSLRESLGAQRRWTDRLVTFPLYVFLALWSIGFGYGFWWSMVAGEDATRTSMASLREDAQTAVSVFAARLEAVQSQLDSVNHWSTSQMTREESSGGTCGIPSGAGRGSLYNARRGIRDSVTALHEGITTSWLKPMQSEVQTLRQGVADIAGSTVQERRRSFEAEAAEIRTKVRRIATRSKELGASTAAEMRSLAGAVAIEPRQPGFSCFDPTLAQLLRQAAEQAAHAPEPALRTASFNEGAAGVANAIKALWGQIGALGIRVVSFGTSGSESPETAMSGRDLIALLATLGIDLGLLALAFLNPPASEIRLDGLAASQARLRLPTSSVVRHLTSAIETAMARGPGVDFEWIRRHFVHHDGASYFVIPNLYGVDQANAEEELRALAMNHLAGVFNDLGLIRTLSRSELKRFGREEIGESYSNLSPLRDHGANNEVEHPVGALQRLLNQAEMAGAPAAYRTRNHGLFAKAQRALDIGGWSAAAQCDVEIFRLVDVGSLTPLLTVLNEGTLAKANEGSAPQTAAANRTHPSERGGLPEIAKREIPKLEHRRVS